MVDKVNDIQDDKALDQAAEERINSLVDGETWSKLSFWQKLGKLWRPQNDDRCRLKNITIKENVFNLLMGSIWPPLIRSSNWMLFSAGVGLDVAERRSGLAWGRDKYDLNDHIYIDVQRKLKKEISKMPLVETEPLGEDILEIPSNIGHQANRLIDARIMKVVSGCGVIGSTLALGPLLGSVLGGVGAVSAVAGLGLASTGIGLFFNRRFTKLSKRSNPFIRAAWRHMLKYRRVANKGKEILEATNKQKDIDEKYALAEQDSKEVDMTVNAKRTKLGAKNVWASLGLMLGTLGYVGAVGLLSGMSLPALVGISSGIFLAGNTFLGSLQRWFSAQQFENDLMIEAKGKYSQIRHRKAYDLKTGSKKLEGNENCIRVSNIQFSFRDKEHPETRNATPVIDTDKTVVFGPGITVLNGPSGCGKSTLYKLLKHWDDLSRGSIEYGTMKNGEFTGTSVTELGDKPELPIGFSFQQLQGFNNFTIDEFWRLAAPNMRDEEIAEWADRFELPIWTNKKKTMYKEMRELSGGELKRAGLVLSLLQKKPILVIDECTSGLDEVLAKKVVDEINELGKMRTIIFTTHNVNELWRLDVKQLVDFHKESNGSTDMTVFKNMTEAEKSNYIAAVHAREPQKKNKSESEDDKSAAVDTKKAKRSLLDLVEACHSHDEEQKDTHVNEYLKKLNATLNYGKVQDLRDIFSAVRANNELAWGQARREGRLREKFKKDLAASFVSPKVRRAANARHNSKSVGKGRASRSR